MTSGPRRWQPWPPRTGRGALDAIRVRFLGRRGALTALLKSVGKLDPEERPAAGARINETKRAVALAIEARDAVLAREQLARVLEEDALDVTLPGRRQTAGSLHPITQTLRRIEDIFVGAGYDVVTGPEIEDDYHNFEALNLPANHPARAMWDTFYLEDGHVLRTHTSPVQVRVMERLPPPIRIICPGRVYRRDSDLTHTPMFHQVEGLVIDAGISFRDLKDAVVGFVHRFYDREMDVRFRPSYFPFTEPSAEVDAQCVHCEGSGCRGVRRFGLARSHGLRNGASERPRDVRYRCRAVHRIRLRLWRGSPGLALFRGGRPAPVLRQRPEVPGAVRLRKL